MPTRSLTSRVLAASGMVGLILLTAVAVRWGLADLYSDHARDWLARWAWSRKVTSIASWESAHAALTKAVRLQPSNPNTLADVGRLYDWKVIGGVTTWESPPSAGASLSYYRSAIREQPTWPHYWVNLALAKYRAGQLDDEFNFAIQRAAEFGPWLGSIQFGLVDVGTAAWRELPRENREIVLEALQRGLQGSKDSYFLRLVEQRRWVSYVCRKFRDENPKLDRYCKRKEM